MTDEPIDFQELAAEAPPTPEVEHRVDGRPRGADYVRGRGDFVEPPPDPEPVEDEGDEEEAIYVDEATGLEYTWDQLTPDEQEAAISEELDAEAAAVQEEEIDAGFERLVQAYPQLNDEAFVDEQFFPVARAIAIEEEAREDAPGLASELLDSSAFLGAVMRELGHEPVLRGGDLFLALAAERDPNHLDWEPS